MNGGNSRAASMDRRRVEGETEKMQVEILRGKDTNKGVEPAKHHSDKRQTKQLEKEGSLFSVA